MNTPTQPALFISHGTLYEALFSPLLREDFQTMRQQVATRPDAIVIFSGHWQTPGGLEVTTISRQYQLEEGFGPEFQTGYAPPGHPALAREVAARLGAAGIRCGTDERRGLDHGALMPLLLLFPTAEVPVIQLSQRLDLDPAFHRRAAEALAPLRRRNILFIGSGGLVHNRQLIQPLSGHTPLPDAWARDFDAFISASLRPDATAISPAERVIQAYSHPPFALAHPTSEHYLPLVFAAAMGTTAKQIYNGFQWKNLSLSAFKFD